MCACFKNCTFKDSTFYVLKAILWLKRVHMAKKKSCGFLTVIDIRQLWHALGTSYAFLFVCLFMAVPALCCCTRAFSSCRKQGPLSRCDPQASRCSGFSRRGVWALGLRLMLQSAGSVVLWPLRSSQTRGWTPVSYVGGWTLYHWASREFLLNKTSEKFNFQSSKSYLASLLQDPLYKQCSGQKL